MMHDALYMEHGTCYIEEPYVVHDAVYMIRHVMYECSRHKPTIRMQS